MEKNIITKLKKILAAVLVASLFAGFSVSGISFASDIDDSQTNSISHPIVKIKYGEWTTPSGEVEFFPYIKLRSNDDCVSDGYTNWVELEIPGCGFQKIFTTYSSFKDQNGNIWALKRDRSGFEPCKGPYSFVWSKKLKAYVYFQNPKNQRSYWDEASECYKGRFSCRVNYV